MVARLLQPDFKNVCVWPDGHLDYGSAMLHCNDPFLSLDCAPTPPPWRNPRKGRDQILPSGNLGHRGQEGVLVGQAEEGDGPLQVHHRERGRGGVDAGDPFAGLQCRGWAPECRTALLPRLPDGKI